LRQGWEGREKIEEIGELERAGDANFSWAKIARKDEGNGEINEL
jgi:hypothetical protein